MNTEYQLDYRRSKFGVVKESYHHQKQSSKRRGHLPPMYNAKGLFLWAELKNEFHSIYKTWSNNGFIKALKPSFDRLDNSKPYTFGNLQIVTYQENVDRHRYERKNNISLDKHVSVHQYDLSGNLISDYKSIAAAERATNTHSSNIVMVCKGARQTAGGFKWSYKC